MVALTLYLVRHASYDALGRVLTGRTPGLHLNPEGRAEAARLADRFEGTDVAAVYASPIERARETAEPIAEKLGLDVSTDEGLVEIDFGDWTGRSFDELRAEPLWRDWNRSRARGQAPGGETMAAVSDRVARSAETWRQRHEGRAVVAVSHADVIKAAVCRILGLSLDRLDRFDIDPGSVTTMALWDGVGLLRRLNEVAA